MSTYSLIVFVHVIAAAIWVGGGFMIFALHELALGAKDRAWLVRMLHFEDLLAKRFFIPASMVTLLAGIGLVLRGPYEMSAGWVGAGLGIWILQFIIGITFFAPAGGRVRAAVEEHGLDSDAVTDKLGRLRTVARLDVFLLAAAIFVMTTKAF